MKPITWFKGVVVAIAMLGLTLQPAIGQELPAETDNPPSELELQAQVAEEPSLHFLLFMGRYDQALEAMVRTADLNALDSEGNTPLTIAARDQSADAYDMVEALLRYGAKPEERDADGRTALHYAVEAGTLSVVQLLVDRYGVDVNVPRLDADGEPIGSEVPVIGALLSGNQRIVKFLEERGADTPQTHSQAELSVDQRRSFQATDFQPEGSALRIVPGSPNPGKGFCGSRGHDIGTV